MAAWMPGASIRHGRNAGYAAGRTSNQTCVCHYTVGRDSTAIGDRGYFNFLVRRNGEIVQFAEVDAVTWHAGNWNSRGPGIEIEFLESYDGPAPANIFTPLQLAAAGRVCQFVSGNTGIPLAFYDGGRTGAWRGFITHRSLIQSGDWHYDYWTSQQFYAAIGGGGGEAPKPKYNPGLRGMICIDTDQGGWYLLGPGHAHRISPGSSVSELQFVGVPVVRMRGLEVIKWAGNFGVPGWNQADTWTNMPWAP